jgi:uncharacterized protein (TIGR03435 family)
MRVITFVMMLLCAQAQDPSLQFEVASIKPAPPPDPSGMRVSVRGGPGTSLFRCENCSLSTLIENAFGIQDYQLSGPDWMQNTRFDISAKIPPGTTQEQYRLMIQNLLMERFKMAFHRDKKEMPVLHLVVAKNGPKFKETQPAETSSPDDDAPQQSGPMKKDANGFPVIPPGKGSSMVSMNGRAAMRSGEETMPGLAAQLSGQLRQPVTDATGLQGKYDIAMTWVPGDAPDNPGPTIYTALQEQLGLKLESKKGTVDTVVIDHLEKTPTEN